MAKSARSKSKIKAKNIKSYTETSDYYQAEEQRRLRIAAKLKEDLERQKALEPAKEVKEDKMDTDEKESEAKAAVKPSKVSKWKAKRRRSKRSRSAYKF